MKAAKLVGVQIWCWPQAAYPPTRKPAFHAIAATV